MPLTGRDALPDSQPPRDASASGTPAGGTAPTIAERTGIVFVHGIGTQAPAETFLDWSRPIVDALRRWSESAGQTDDPVVRSHYAFNASTPAFLELRIPPRDGNGETRWLVTEAWWAAEIRAPTLRDVAKYLGPRMGAIAAGIAAGYRARAARSRGRRSEHGLPQVLDWADRLDRWQARLFGMTAIAYLIAGLGSIALAWYSILRALPIGPLRQFVELRLLDSFLIDWFGDLPVLLGDPVQAANVRARVAASIDFLRQQGADSIVLIAHSGGAIVSYETLLDPVYADRPVAKLVTLGQGLGLGRRLEATPGVHFPLGDRLRGNMSAARPELRWVDMWASYDPAPAGPICSPDDDLVCVADLADAPRPNGPNDPLPVEDRPVTNRMNVLNDHGTYWENAEGFLIPLVRHLDKPRTDAGGARFYIDRGRRWERIERRRRRVAVLAAWGWLCSFGAIGAVVLMLLADAISAATHVALPFAGRLAAAGDGVANVVARIPGSELITAPIDGAGRLIGAAVDWVVRLVLGDGAAASARDILGFIGGGGPGLVGAVLVALLFLFLVSRGNGRWDAWDQHERTEALAEAPPIPNRRVPLSEGTLLAGGWLGVVAAVLGAPVVVVAIELAVAAVVGLVVRVTYRPPTSAPTSPTPA